MAEGLIRSGGQDHNQKKQVFMILYHVTTQKNLRSILVEGLDPLKSKSSLKAVFLSNDKYTALNYASMHAVEPYALLEIRLSDLDQSELGPDNYELKDWLDSKDKEELDALGVYSWNEATWEQSLEWCCQVAYHAPIDPKAITVLRKYEVDDPTVSL
jgi:hypothetical protein